MKKINIFLLLCILISPILGAEEMSFPEDYYFLDTESDFRILLGTYYLFIDKHYFDIAGNDLLFESKNPPYEIWKTTYKSGLQYIYSTYSNIITYIRVNSSRFVTSRGLKVGDEYDKIIKIYGDPSFAFVDKSGLTVYLYECIHEEINLDGRRTVVRFKLDDEKIVEIVYEIESTV